MTRRLIDSAIWQNEKFASLPAMGRLLSIGMINNADDQGRGKAHPAHLRSLIFPYDDITLSDISGWLTLIAENETITVYQVDGKDYYQIINWWTYQAHQYAMPSQYPKPEGWNDRIRKTITPGTIATCNWITKGGSRSPDTCDEQGLLIELNSSPSLSPDVSPDGSPDDGASQSGEGTRLRLSLSSNTRLHSKTNGKSDEALIDPELVQAIGLWNETFAGTPYEGNAPVHMLPRWIDFGGVDILCHMIGKSKDKENPGGWLYSAYDKWLNAGEVAPYIAKQVAENKAANAPLVTKVVTIDFGDGTFEEREVQTRGI